MHKSFLLLAAFLLLCSHDLYIKMETYFLQPNQEAILSLYNGTFEVSENIITRDRMLDASFVAHGKRVAISPDQWEDHDSTITHLFFRTGEEGTYVAGVATKARNIALSAQDFNNYLEHDGVLDMLEQRTNDSTLDQDAVESYQKHVKAIYQVGNRKTNDWSTVLGYPIEFVPQANPYDTYSGEKLEVQLLLDGEPLSNQLVYADYLISPYGHSHGDESDAHDGESHTHTSGQQLRTNDQGMVMVDLPEDGLYYLRTIHMVRATDSDELTHRSTWATLTFEVTHTHDASTDTHDHEHDHDHADELPTWIFVLGSMLVIGALFLVFRKPN